MVTVPSRWSLVLLLSVGGCFTPDDAPMFETDAGSSMGSTAATVGADASSSSPTTMSSTTTANPTSTSDPTDTTTTANPTAGSSSATDPTSSTDSPTSVGDSSSGGDDDSTSEGMPVSCNPLLDECANDEFCSAPDCSSTGTCIARPPSTSADYQPVCGCDGASYWNMQHANWLGITARPTEDPDVWEGACEEPGCFDDDDCPAATVCVTVFGLGQGTCGADATEGRCYGIPDGPSCDGAPAAPGSVAYGACSAAALACPDDAALTSLCEGVRELDFYQSCF